MQLLQYEPRKAYSVIKITIILQHTNSYMFRQYWLIIREHTIVQNICLTLSACSSAAENSTTCNIYVADRAVKGEGSMEQLLLLRFAIIIYGAENYVMMATSDIILLPCFIEITQLIQKFKRQATHTHTHTDTQTDLAL